jgi:hypothetical protein
MMDYQKLFKSTLDRRRLLGNLGMMGAGAVITACGGAAVGQPNPEPEPQPEPSANLDAAILNFALNLEYLEAAFYLAAVGRIDEINTVGGDAEIILPEGFDGTTSIAFDTPEVAAYADEIATDELKHVLFLRTALADLLSQPVADRPVIDFANAFPAAAAAAFDLTLTRPPRLTPLPTSCCSSTAPLSSKMSGSPPTTAPLPMSPISRPCSRTPPAFSPSRRTTRAKSAPSSTSAAMKKRPLASRFPPLSKGISNLRAEVGGGKDQGIVNEDGSANIVPTDDNSVAFARTPTRSRQHRLPGQRRHPRRFLPQRHHRARRVRGRLRDAAEPLGNDFRIFRAACCI